MAREYRVSCSPTGLRKIGKLLQRLGGQPSPQFPVQIEFCFQSGSTDDMPDATVILESEGICFVDHGGERAQVAVLFRQIIDEALTYSGESESVVITTI